MLGYVRSIGERSHDLISHEPIIFLDVFDFVACGKSTEYRCDIDSCALDKAYQNEFPSPSLCQDKLPLKSP